MGDERIVSSPDPAQRGRKFHEIFEELCPQYLAIGMTYEQFWYGDCTMAKAYRAAYKLKQKQINEQAWLQGLYIYEALCDAAPIFNAFAKRGTKPHKYPTEPYPLSKEEREAKEEARRRERYLAHRDKTFKGKKKK